MMALQDGKAPGNPDSNGENTEETFGLKVNNTPANRKKVKAAARKVTKLKDQRDELTAEINSQRAEMKALGVPKSIFDEAMRLGALDEAKLRRHDEAMHMCREALDIPVQAALFQ